MIPGGRTGIIGQQFFDDGLVHFGGLRADGPVPVGQHNGRRGADPLSGLLLMVPPDGFFQVPVPVKVLEPGDVQVQARLTRTSSSAMLRQSTKWASSIRST